MTSQIAEIAMSDIEENIMIQTKYKCGLSFLSKNMSLFQTCPNLHESTFLALLGNE